MWRVRKEGLFWGSRRRWRWQRPSRLSRHDSLHHYPTLHCLGWPTLRPTLPQTYANLIKPKSAGRNALCSPKAEAPRRWTQGCFHLPIPPSPPSFASPGTWFQPRENWGAGGLPPTGPPAVPRRSAPRVASQELCVSPSLRDKVPESKLPQTTSRQGTATPELVPRRWGGDGRLLCAAVWFGAGRREPGERTNSLSSRGA